MIHEKGTHLCATVTVYVTVCKYSVITHTVEDTP